MDPKDKIKAISDERIGLRQEIIAQSQAINRCVFSSMAVFAVLAGIYWNKELVAQPEARAFLLVVLSQLVFALVVFAIMLNAAICNVGDYIAALELKINELAEDKITAWESKIVKKVIWHPSSPFFWSAALLNICLLCLFIGSFTLALLEIIHPLFILLVALESLIAVLLYGWIFAHRKHTQQFAMAELRLTDLSKAESIKSQSTQQITPADAAKPRR